MPQSREPSDTLQIPQNLDPSIRPLRAFVHLGYGFDAAKHRELHVRGLAPDEVPYGFHHAEKMNCEVSYSEDMQESLVSRLIRKALTRLLGFDVIHAYRNRRRLFSSDIIWTMEERQFLAVIFLGCLLRKRPFPKIIAQTVWLFNDWSGYSSARKWFLTKLLNKATCLSVHSNEYLSEVRRIVPSARLELLKFGISLDTFPFSPGRREIHSPIRVFTLGNDPTRDWKTMLAAFANNDQFEVVAVSRSLTDEMVRGMRNIRIVRDPSMEQFRSLYRWADYVFIPMVSNLYSGITVALEATSMGTPVVCSDTGGVPTYFDGDQVLYVPVENPAALRDAILACTEERRTAQLTAAQARFLREDYSSAGMIRRYIELSKQLTTESA